MPRPQNALRLAARAKGLEFFLDESPCVNGHRPPVLRSTANNRCCECRREQCTRYKAAKGRQPREQVRPDFPRQEGEAADNIRAKPTYRALLESAGLEGAEFYVYLPLRQHSQPLKQTWPLERATWLLNADSSEAAA